ncbi:MAG: serine protease Do [Chthoniobacter sp.]|jgi:Do/DeqQ family serine protease|nr:serine protease Do [Chthoniobacter sp.]
MILNRFTASAGCLFISSIAAFSAADQPPVARDVIHQLDDAFVGVFEKVASAVVVIEADKKAGADNPDENFDFFFGNPRGRGGQGGQGRRQPQMPAPLTRSEGSGFIVRPDGFIFTNSHVIEDAAKVEVKLKDGRRFTAKVVGSDDKTDIAVLKIEAANLPVAKLGDSDAVRVGQLCFAIGVPYTLDYSFSGGFVSAKGRSNLTADPTHPKYEDYIQTDAFINPGNSGGPLFDIDGRIIGMNTLINGIGRGLAFAIPSNMLTDVGDQLMANGKITRPWLGIRIETLGDNPSLAEHITGVEKGVVVDTIEPDAPAYKSDLRPADVITRVDGIPVASARDLQKEVLKKKVGQSVELAIWRNGKPMKVAVTTGELPSDFAKVANTTAPKKAPETSVDALYGLKVQDLGKELAEKMKTKSGGGVVVTEVEAGSVADEAGIERGDVITEVDEKPVQNSAAFHTALKTRDSSKGVLLFIERSGQKTYAVLKVVEVGKTK